MLSTYFPILIFLGIGVVLGCAPLVIGRILGPHRPDEAKGSPYECGFNAFENARLPFDVRFYLVAILFIIFDLETAFLFPWAIVMHRLHWFGFVSMMIFLSILIVGFVYEWCRGALSWE